MCPAYKISLTVNVFLICIRKGKLDFIPDGKKITVSMRPFLSTVTQKEAPLF